MYIENGTIYIIKRKKKTHPLFLLVAWTSSAGQVIASIQATQKRQTARIFIFSLVSLVSVSQIVLFYSHNEGKS